MSDGMVRRWCRRTNVHDDDKNGCPSLVTADLLDQVNEKIRENRRFTMSELSTHFLHISHSLLHEIIMEHLQYHKLCARWVPKVLTDDLKTYCMGAALKFLVRYHNEGDEFLNRGLDFPCDHKQQSVQWRHSASPKAKKCEQTLSARKIMCSVFWDRHDVLLIDIMTQGTTVNSDVYCETVSKLLQAIQNKRRGLVSSGVLLLHDSAQPHTAARTRQLLEQL
jgi:histone-lysine N-methyltransferase SETMAR